MTARRDLTRWNRAGLSRVAYVDGNAPIFLEHLRAAMIAKFLRGVDPAEDGRDPDFWFDLLRDADHPMPGPAIMQGYRGALDWAALAEGLPQVPESQAARARRISANYDGRSEDYAVEIMRAFARVSHVFAGYVDAYVNEGFLSTATQWSSLQKLGEMVNYAPAPPASAGDSVALIVAAGSGTRKVPAGLAMSAAPATGGAPVVFETLGEIVTHPDLNAVRQRRWLRNRTEMILSEPNDWLLAGGPAPAPGTPVIIAPGKMTNPSAKPAVIATARAGAVPGSVSLATVGGVEGTWRKGYTEMWHSPDTTLIGLPVPSDGVQYFRMAGANGVPVGSVVQIRYASGAVYSHVVAYAQNDRIGLYNPHDLSDVEAIRPLLAMPFPNGWIDAAVPANFAYFTVGTGVRSVAQAFGNITTGQAASGEVRTTGGVFIAQRYLAPAGASWGGLADSGADWTEVTLLHHPPQITPALTDPATIVPFRGKPPKALTEGSYMLARGPDGNLTALRVRGISTGKDEFAVAFNKAPGSPPEKTQFLGPMTKVLRPVHHDRNEDPVIDPDGVIALAGLSDDAKALIRIGKRVIVEDERETGRRPILATVEKVEAASGNTEKGERDQVRIRLRSNESSLDAFAAGWTVFRFNTIAIGHGESKGAKTLGSGNAERSRQVLPLDVSTISFVPDAASASGVRPDIEVTVDGTLWAYADLTDPTAEDTASYSIRPRDDGTLDLVFRRRLPSGKNNVSVRRHRVGAGQRGNGIGPRALTKPKSKHRFVEGVVQPFATAGGADRETTASIRDTAGAAIAANDRAVSLEDFARLVRRHSSIWDARAVERTDAGRGARVRITVVPAGGVDLNPDLAAALHAYLAARALPGVRTEVAGFGRLPVTLSATIRADLAQHAEDDLRDACTAALARRFALSQRGLGQHLFVADVLATLEAVAGVETARAAIALGPGVTPAPGQVFTGTGGAIRAVYPTATEVAFVAATTDITIAIEGPT